MRSPPLPVDALRAAAAPPLYRAPYLGGGSAYPSKGYGRPTASLCRGALWAGGKLVLGWPRLGERREGRGRSRPRPGGRSRPSLAPSATAAGLRARGAPRAAGMGLLPWPRPRPPLLLLLLPPLGCFALLLPPPAATEFSPSLDSDFTFTLPAGRKECFYQPMRKEASLELEYQVLDGAGLDVDFHLLSPKGETLVFDERKSDGVHTVETEDGDYMFCFDNTFSTISEKVIFFELILDNMGEDGQDQEDWKKYVTGTDLLDMKLEDILESINSVKARLSKSVQIQTLLRAFEARDRNIQESNFDRVNFWSMVNLGVMMVVSAVQVYMLKSLFEDKRKSRT
ncbi:transmembrane emp24 domain-containing protein 5 [Accipiter gentilis]|uniref:transmembrane emp24 domain-containing protein 5 n=1 Tax=Astur gentilis TaxID=8957 RepID=UPI00210F5243|nr:transmembrane emp24 domain-containing protein 5 [Accipiter gentilis]